jgi:sugar/nucleoside kinase (ribokinase family)
VNKYDSAGNRTQIVESLANAITPGDFSDNHIDASIIHFSPLTAGELDIDCFKLARSNVEITSLDAQGYLRSIDSNGMVIPRNWVDSDEILGLVDVVKFDESELKMTIDSESELSAVSEILNLGPKIVLVTHDRRGSVIYTKNEQISIPVIRADTYVDATGCGDTYAIAFLLEYMRSSDLKKAGFFAATCSSFNVETVGPYNMPSRLDVERRLRGYLED